MKVAGLEDGIHHTGLLLVALDSGRVFLTQRSIQDDRAPGKWEFPGGGVDPGEDFIDALKRELNEELGVEELPEGEIVNIETEDGYALVIYAIPSEADWEWVMTDEVASGAWFNPDEIEGSDLLRDACLDAPIVEYAEDALEDDGEEEMYTEDDELGVTAGWDDSPLYGNEEDSSWSPITEQNDSSSDTTEGDFEWLDPVDPVQRPDTGDQYPSTPSKNQSSTTARSHQGHAMTRQRRQRVAANWSHNHEVIENGTIVAGQDKDFMEGDQVVEGHTLHGRIAKRRTAQRTAPRQGEHRVPSGPAPRRRKKYDEYTLQTLGQSRDRRDGWGNSDPHSMTQSERERYFQQYPHLRKKYEGERQASKTNFERAVEASLNDSAEDHRLAVEGEGYLTFL